MFSISYPPSLRNKLILCSFRHIYYIYLLQQLLYLLKNIYSGRHIGSSVLVYNWTDFGYKYEVRVFKTDEITV